jgi:colanic acid biosynthesis glycosyl transferase WcaI
VRVAIYGLNYAPELIGIARYNTELAEWLTRRGHAVQVICAPPYYPNWKLQPGYRSWLYQQESRADVDILRCPTWIPSVPSGLRRILHLLSFVLSSFPALFWRVYTTRPDIIFVLEPSLFCIPGALLIAKLFKCKTWVHVQDLELDAGFNLGLVPNFKAIRQLAFTCESWFLQRAEIVSTISDEMAQRLQEKGISQQQMVLFPNWVDTRDITPLEANSTFREQMGITPDQIVCLYAGNLGYKQGLEILVQVAHHLQQHPQIVLVIAGEGPLRHSLQLEAQGLSNLHFLGLQPQSQLGTLLGMANLHLLPQAEKTSALFFPSKIKAMFASGRPVIATADASSQLAQVVVGKGVVVPPGNVKQLSSAIQLLSQDRNLRERLGMAARHYAMKHWERDCILGDIERRFISLMANKSMVSEGERT